MVSIRIAKQMSIYKNNRQSVLLVMRTLPSFLNMFIFGTMIAYGVQITQYYSDHRYGLVVQGQGQKYLNLSFRS